MREWAWNSLSQAYVLTQRRTLLWYLRMQDGLKGLLYTLIRRQTKSFPPTC